MTGRPSRCVITLIGPADWHPPGVPAGDWRRALADDVVDVVAALADVAGAVAAAPADADLAREVCWPGMAVYPAADPLAALRAAAEDGYEQAAVLAADVPDLPALQIGKLLRPLTSRAVALAPDLDGGLVGIAARLPLPAWLSGVSWDTQPAAVRARAPRPGDVAVAPGWYRQRGAAQLARLDPGLEGWEATRALLAP